MQVYSVLYSVEYEGDQLLGVFGDRESAVAFARQHEYFGESEYEWYSVVESELGRSVESGRVEYIK